MLIREKGEINWAEHRSRFVQILLSTERTLVIRRFSPTSRSQKKKKSLWFRSSHREKSHEIARVFPSTLHFYDFISVDMVALTLIVDKEINVDN